MSATKPSGPQLTDDINFEVIDLREGLKILSRRRWTALICFLGCVLIATLFLIRAPRIYQASASVLIEQTTPTVLGRGVEEVYDLGDNGYWDSQKYYQTQYQIIKSRPVAEKTLSILGISPQDLAKRIEAAGVASLEDRLAEDPLGQLSPDIKRKIAFLGLSGISNRESLVESLHTQDHIALLQSRIQLETERESRLVRINIEDTDPERAALMANAVADAYIHINLAQKVATTETAVGWLSEQVIILKDRVNTAEQALYNFKKTNQIVSVSLEDRQSITRQTLAQLNKSRSELKAKLLTLQSKRSQLKEAVRKDKSLASLGAHQQIASSRLIQDLKTALSKVKQEESELRFRYTDAHPRVSALQRKRGEIQHQLTSEINQILQTLEQEYQAATDTEKRLGEQIALTKARALEFNKNEVEYKRLKRDAAHNLELYSIVLKRQKEAQLSQMLKVNNVRRLEAAIAPLQPIRPRGSLVMLLSLVLGVLSAITAAFIVDTIDNTIKSQDQIESSIGLAFLGILPAIKTGEDTPSTTPTNRDQYILSNPRSGVAECSRTIRTNIMFMSPENPTRSLVVTSSGPQEGKSTTVINLAITMANAGARTIIVDTDLRRPRLHRSFQISSDTGISNTVLGETTLEEAIVPSPIENLDLLPCGPIPPNPSEIFHTQSFKNILAELGEKYDRVLFDSPPVSAVTDATILSSMTDGVVFVAKAHQTTLPAIKQSKKRLEDVGGNILGLVLNNVDLDDKRAGGSYYQYYYYRSGYYYGEEQPEASQA